MIADDPDSVLREQNLTYTLTINNQSPDPADNTFREETTVLK
jgi:uncharacterized repeat protein (TIGR01451 family)